MRSELRSYVGMIIVAIVAVVAFGALGMRIDQAHQQNVPAGIHSTPAISGNAPDLLVDAQWMLRYGVQVDYIFDLSDIRVYEAGHIPNAHHLWWQDAMAQHSNNYGEPDQISEAANSGDVFSRLKLNVPQNARIVLYDSNSSERASWMLWVMRSNGYTDVLLLDGGLQAWIGAGGEITTEVPSAPTHASIAKPGWIGTWEIRREPLLEEVQTGALQIIDTRDADEQADTVNGTIRPGNIPGAISITNNDVLRPDGTFRSVTELQQVFADVGLDPDQPVIVYSLFSKDSGPVWIALQLAGYSDARIYREGYVAWGYNVDLPIETTQLTNRAQSEATPEATSVPTPRATATPSPTVSPSGTAITAPTPTEGPTDLTGD